MILGLSHIGLTVKDLESSIEFYQRQLGFPVLSDAERKGEAAEKITGIPGIHTRNVYLSVSPTQHLEVFGFYNPQPLPPHRKAALRVQICYAAFMKGLGQNSGEIVPAFLRQSSQRVKDIEEAPYRGCPVEILLDPDGIELRVMQSIPVKGQESESWELLYPALMVENIQRSVDFYFGLLGLEVETEGSGLWAPGEDLSAGFTGMDIHWVLLRSRGGPCLKLFRPLNFEIKPAPAWQMQRVGLSHFAFAITDLKKHYPILLQKKAIFQSPPQTAAAGPHKGGQGVYLRTPDGFVVELIDSPLTKAADFSRQRKSA
jgi:catechol 2,3-dioxygenase-like lactoylglutathione lyase family enzyme